MPFEEKFKISLKRYMKDNFINTTILADKAGISEDVFSKLLNTSQKVYGEDVIRICNATGLTLKEILYNN